MKKQFIPIGLAVALLSACSSQDQNEETVTYSYDYHVYNRTPDLNVDDQLRQYIIPSAYEITMDESFDRVTRYHSGLPPSNMLFWHKQIFNEMKANIETTASLDDLKTELPTLEILTENKYQQFILTNVDDVLENPNDDEIEQMLDEFLETVENPPDEHLEQYIVEMLSFSLKDATFTEMDEPIGLFSHQIDYDEDSYEHIAFVGETNTTYVTATVTIPNNETEEYRPIMDDALHHLTFDPTEFRDNPNYDFVNPIKYDPEGFGDSFPDAKFSFRAPSMAQFSHSSPSVNPYSFNFSHYYSDSETLDQQNNVSSLSVSVEERGEQSRETEARAQRPQDFVVHDEDEVVEIDAMHKDETMDNGLFTTAMRIEYKSGFEEYQFLYETDDHVFEIEFTLSPNSIEADDLLNEYMRVVQSFELET
ncbi:hypothetical protein ACE1TH_15665 [Shouchella sp. JSM 1781072]|uniref:hypothetical protein n=1 Tax=Shouchella sp. JSM 1781072 TaxID=3344581 RepID=UPI0035BECB70